MTEATATASVASEITAVWQAALGDTPRVTGCDVRSPYAKYLPQRRTMMQAWADHLDSLRAQTELAVSHQAGERAALTAMDAFQHADSERLLRFQTQAMVALHAIMSLGKRQ